MRKTRRSTLALTLAVALTLGAAGGALAAPDSPDARANCVGVGSSYAARFGIVSVFGVFDRAAISHLVKELFAVPGEEARHIAHDIERGSIQSCLAPLAGLVTVP